MKILVEQDVRVRMRDGIDLATDIYRPATGSPRPVLLQRTPYGRETGLTTPEWSSFVSAGYVVAQQDTRGRFDSEGAFIPYVHEAHDGQDTLAWLAAQPWSDGTAAMIGASYYGQTQWLAAIGDCPSLRAIAPQITSSSLYDGWTYRGGALQLGFVLTWVLEDLAPPALTRNVPDASEREGLLAALTEARTRIDDRFRNPPLTVASQFERLAPYYLDWLAHPAYDEYWRATAVQERYGHISVPSLNIGGWYDCFLGGTLANYLGVKSAAATESARRPRLIVGPWSHGSYSGVYPERSFGPAGSEEAGALQDEQIRFFDHHLRGLDNGVDQQPPVRLFVMGENRWRQEADWPLPDTVFTPYYLNSGGNANTADGDGRLLVSAPGDQPADRYCHDPADPVPTVGGQTFLPGVMMNANAGPRDQRSVERRRDVLCYTSDVLREDLEVTGPVTLTLWIVSSVVDTDFTGKLVDVHPDGLAIILTDGILRARYRDSATQPSLLEPGTAYELTIDMWATSNLFKAGHRIRLEVASSNFPRFDCNDNTGADGASEGERTATPAVNDVLHDASHPSHLLLPLIRR